MTIFKRTSKYTYTFHENQQPSTKFHEKINSLADIKEYKLFDIRIHLHQYTALIHTKLRLVIERHLSLMTLDGLTL